MSKPRTAEDLQKCLDIYWLYKLNSSLRTIYNELKRKNQIELKEVTLEVNDSASHLGLYTAMRGENGAGRIAISYKLINNYEWAAVEYVMRHEIAHQIVEEHFKSRVDGVSHGEFFKTACEMLGIDASRTTSREKLNGFKGDEENPVVDKVRKLLAKGYDTEINKEEADLFLSKAHEIMLKHNINMRSVTGKDEIYLARIFGGIGKTIPTYMCRLAGLLKNYYNIEYILMTTYMNGKRRKFVEIFGEPSNLDVAEYIGTSLLVQANELFEEHKKINKGDRYTRNSRNAFICGVINGYESTLIQREEVVTKDIEEVSPSALISLNHAKELRREAFDSKYKPRAGRSRGYGYGKGYSEGVSKGSGIRIGAGITSSGSRGNLLTA